MTHDSYQNGLKTRPPRSSGGASFLVRERNGRILSGEQNSAAAVSRKSREHTVVFTQGSFSIKESVKKKA